MAPASLPEDIQAVREQILREKRVAFKVVSGSMEPVIMTGEMIEVSPLDLTDARVFDILLFWNGKILICHYLWHINSLPDVDGSQVVVTRSLAGNGEDLPVPSSRILGKIASHRIPGRTRARLILRTLFRRYRHGVIGQ